jgi:hypothetical protein
MVPHDRYTFWLNTGHGLMRGGRITKLAARKLSSFKAVIALAVYSDDEDLADSAKETIFHAFPCAVRFDEGQVGRLTGTDLTYIYPRVVAGKKKMRGTSIERVPENYRPGVQLLSRIRSDFPDN